MRSATLYPRALLLSGQLTGVEEDFRNAGSVLPLGSGPEQGGGEGHVEGSGVLL